MQTTTHNTIDVRDLRSDQVRLVHRVVRLLRRNRTSDDRLHTVPVANDTAWSSLAATSFAADWDNPQDALYDNWQKIYDVPQR
ncbi:MAG: hypothetical protein Q8R39_04330 [bacterium]|nr:hypothetical protein [bacterium]MDZ4284584.1 hypothetical protein [Patescibacteria group bacterium]